MSRFADKVVIITGGGTGIGKATAINFAKEGAKIMIMGRREAPLMETVSEIKEFNNNIEFISGDASKSEDVDKLIERTVNVFKTLDIFINNAAVTVAKKLEDITNEDLDFVLSVNLKGYFYGMRSSILKFKELKKPGVIVNVSSQLGLAGHLYRSVYCGAKAAINNITRVAAMECGQDGIRINAICPGVIETDMARKAFDAKPDPVREMLPGIPMGRMGSTDEVAKVIMFLASDDSSYMTGSIVTVDGGFTCGK